VGDGRRTGRGAALRFWRGAVDASGFFCERAVFFSLVNRRRCATSTGGGFGAEAAAKHLDGSVGRRGIATGAKNVGGPLRVYFRARVLVGWTAGGFGNGGVISWGAQWRLDRHKTRKKKPCECPRPPADEQGQAGRDCPSCLRRREPAAGGSSKRPLGVVRWQRGVDVLLCEASAPAPARRGRGPALAGGAKTTGPTDRGLFPEDRPIRLVVPPETGGTTTKACGVCKSGFG